MPTPQPSPGPSKFSTILLPLNIRKRTVSEFPTEGDSSQPIKKFKTELSDSDTERDFRVKSKKRRKKKKKKSPVTAPDSNHEGILSQPKPSDSILPLLGVTTGIQSPPSRPSDHIGSSGCGSHPVSLKNEQLVLSLVDKGKTRAVPEQSDHLVLQPKEYTLAPPVSEGSDPMKEAQVKIAELEAQLQSQKKLLSQYADNLSSLHQSLTCQICLDLLYKPFALSPCGHVACYLCLIRWFTSLQNNDNVNPVSRPEDIPLLLSSRGAARGVYLRKCKTCPLCRAAVTERPVEIWSIKSMVASLTKSKLVDLPSSPPPAEVQTNVSRPTRSSADPWWNIFRKTGWGEPPTHPPSAAEGGGGGIAIEDMGMWDAEDSVYRCLECMHEIWGGLCTSCDREYPGHLRLDGDESESDNESDREHGENFLGRRLRQIYDGYARNHRDAWDAEEDIQMNMLWGPYLPGLNSSDDSMDGDLSESELGDREVFESDSAEDSLESWDSTDGENGDQDGDLVAHYRDVIQMRTHVPHWPFRLQVLPREGRGGAHIEEVADVAEEEDPNSDSHSHSEGEDEYEQDSFIDDEEDVPQYHLRSGYSRPRLRPNEPDSDSVLLHSDDSDAISVSEHQVPATELRRSMRLREGTGIHEGAGSGSISNFEDEEETGDDEGAGEVCQRHRYRLRRGSFRPCARIRHSTDEGSDGE